jgi:putative ABC transport system permease protein
MTSLRYALRMLFKTPFVTLVAIVSLAFGIGANAAIFSLFNQMLLRPLPVPEPDRLVYFESPGPRPGSNSCGLPGSCEQVFSYQMMRDLQKAQTVFTGIAGHVLFGANIAARAQTSNGVGAQVSGSYFPVLALTPAAGRLLTPDDDKVVGESHVVVLSYGFWERRFGADPSIVNQPIIVNGQSLTVVGVAPKGFDGTTLGVKPQVYVPITMRGEMSPGFKGFDNRRSYWAYLLARLKPGVSLKQAQTAMAPSYHAIINDVDAPLQKGMSEQTLGRFKAKPLLLRPAAHGQSNVTNVARAPLTLLLGVTAFVLLIACANIANLLLARSASRAGEMAIRLSIGASRPQLVRQLMLESMLLAIVGGVAGLFVSRWTLDLIVTIASKEAADTIDIAVDPRVIAFTGVLAIGTGLAFGLFPALHSTRTDLVSSLKGQAGQPAGARAAARFRHALATTQIALSMALLVAAGLFTRSLMNVSRVDLGLNPESVVVFTVSPTLNGYSPARTAELFERLEDALAAMPAAAGVTSSRVPLLAGNNWGRSMTVEGFNAGPDTNTDSNFNAIGPAYFHVLGVPMLAGREFTRADSSASAKVAIVNEAFAKKFNLGRDAVGKRIGDDDRNGPLTMEIVGLVRNAKYSEVKQEIPPVYFRPYRQDTRLDSMTFYVRTAGDTTGALSDIPKIVARLDPNLPLEDLRTLPQQIRENVFLDRFITILSAAFAGLATLLAAIGLYGVLAYTVSQRTREIGLRMALGAAPTLVRRMVLRQVALMTLVGGALGLAAAIGLGRLAESLLYQLKGWDPQVLVGAAVALTAVALGAGFVPAHRASQVDPMTALRHE